MATLTSAIFASSQEYAEAYSYDLRIISAHIDETNKQIDCCDRCIARCQKVITRAHDMIAKFPHYPKLCSDYQKDIDYWTARQKHWDDHKADLCDDLEFYVKAIEFVKSRAVNCA